MPEFVFSDTATTLSVVLLLVVGLIVGFKLRKRCSSLAVVGVPALMYAVLIIVTVTISTQVVTKNGSSIEAAKAMGLESGNSYQFALGMTDGVVMEGPLFSIDDYDHAYTRDDKLIVSFYDGTQRTALEFPRGKYTLEQSNTKRPSATVTLTDTSKWRGKEGWYSRYSPVSSTPCNWVIKNLALVCERVITRKFEVNEAVTSEGLDFVVNTTAQSSYSDTRITLVLPAAQYTQLVTGGNK